MTDERIHILVCDYYLGEVQAAIASGAEFDGVTVSAFPSRCGHPKLAREEIIRRLFLEDVEADILGSTCLADTGTISKNDHFHVTFPCFNMFSEHSYIEKSIGNGAYLLTPGWLSHWRDRIEAWGFTQVDLRRFLQETTKRLVLLDTGIDAKSATHLEEFADYVDLPYTVTPVGLDFFTQFLKIIVLNRRLELQKLRANQATMALRHKSSDYAMAMDLLGKFTQVQSEEETIRLILEIFNMLFAPQELSYVCFEGGRPSLVHRLNRASCPPDDGLIQRIAGLPREDSWKNACDGFFRVTINDETLGVVLVDRITFPEYREHYLNLTLTILLPICSLTLNNARNFQQIIQTEEELQKANDVLKRLATMDGLTQVANRRHFDSYLAQEWRRACREKLPISLTMIDVDHFKQYNDTYGHQAGDDCLRALARIASSCVCRPADLFARYGGEEFSLILPNTTAEGASHLAEEVRSAVEQAQIRHSSSTVKPFVTISLGVATMTASDSVTEKVLIELADQALYRAKAGGRNRVACGSPLR
jgi:diguanylate cyclase (GGDEF)-like protein